MIGGLWEGMREWRRQRHLRLWDRRAREAERLDLGRLEDLRDEARDLRARIDRVLHAADTRLALPLLGSNGMRRPLGADWMWRPDLWRGRVASSGHAAIGHRTDLGGGVTVFHDCDISEISARQIRNTREIDLAPFGLRIDVFRFDGSFLSLVLDLPEAGAQGLRSRHVVRLEVAVEMEAPLELFGRLNIQHGPNVEQVVREMPVSEGNGWAEFDLAYTGMNERRVDKAWLDLIFEGPQMNQFVLRDVTVSRRPRAEL